MAASLALGPLSILLANQLALGRPLAPLQHISNDHLALAAEYAAGWYPPLWRAANVAFWPGVALVALTPGFALLALRGLGRRPAREAWPTLAMALVAPGIYLARGLLLGTFLPLMRMVLAPAALLACAAPAPSRRAWVACIAVAAFVDAGTLALAEVPNPLQGLAQRATPVERLPDDLRAGVEVVRASPGPVAIDQSGGWEDIVIAHHAGRDRFALYAPSAAPTRVVSIAHAKLEGELEAGRGAFGQRCAKAGELGRISWWDCRSP
jgi:hypothetical protein